MEKIIEESFKIFSHLARDIQTYMIAGFILLCDFYFIDRTYYSQNIYSEIIEGNYPILILIFSSYILGQVCLAFYTLLLEITNIDKFLYKHIFSKRFISISDSTDEKMLADKGYIFRKNKEVYLHFVERDVNLSTLRWNYSAAFFICFIIDTCYYLIVNDEVNVLIIGLVAFFCSICLMLIHIYTQKETAFHILNLKEQLPADGENVNP